MNYFFVFQNKSYKEERTGSYLWAPQKNQKGQRVSHWSEMENVKKGDIIFNSYNAEMLSIIVVKEDSIIHEKPADLDNIESWEKEGWIVYGDYYDLKVPLVYKEHMDEILNLQGERYAPFNKIGRGNTGYLFKVTPQLAEYLFSLIGIQNGEVLDQILNVDRKLEEEFISKVEDLPKDIDETEREQIIKSRIGQSIFKKKLLKINESCRLCGVVDERFLIASHIKKWSQSNNQERLDENNGVLLCPNHDSLFDKGYISFNDDGDILISTSLDYQSMTFLNINESMKINMNSHQSNYMKWHRENRFKQ